MGNRSTHHRVDTGDMIKFAAIVFLTGLVGLCVGLLARSIRIAMGCVLVVVVIVGIVLIAGVI